MTVPGVNLICAATFIAAVGNANRFMISRHLRAFYERTKARRGHGKRSSRPPKLAILFWCMLTRGEDYAHQQPSLTKKATAPRDHRRRAEEHAPRRWDLVNQRPDA